MRSMRGVMVMGLLALLVFSGCFVSDDNDDNPANAVSPSSILTGNYVLSLVINDNYINTNPNSTDAKYTMAKVILTNSDGSGAAGVTVRVWASEQKDLVGFTETLDSSTIVQGYSCMTDEDGTASFFVWLSTDAECAIGSIPIVAQTYASSGSDAPIVVAYNWVYLENSGPVACP